MQSVIKLSLGILVIMLLSSCNNNPYYERTQPSDIEGYGKTYLYIEQYPVEGLEYECGYLDRVRTDNYGGFLYEEGTSCRFYYRDNELFSISNDQLINGRIYEIFDENTKDILYSADINIDPNKIVIGD
ncbi:MAG: hypothetical protein U9N49_11345 [Campylobacterota bacterium]|nr:hypothetical protein [Campylobacterota bacterium]